jgi:hypothetical protein
MQRVNTSTRPTLQASGNYMARLCNHGCDWLMSTWEKRSVTFQDGCRALLGRMLDTQGPSLAAKSSERVPTCLDYTMPFGSLCHQPWILLYPDCFQG